MKLNRKFKIYYNDGVFAQNMIFNDTFTDDKIEEYLTEVIKEFNTNINKDYHITRSNIIEI